MQHELTETSEQVSQTGNSPFSSHSSQHGLHHSRSGGLHDLARVPSRGDSPRSVLVGESSDVVNPDQLGEQLRQLRDDSSSPEGHARPLVPGQRVSEYERALTPSRPKQTLGFKVVKRQGSQSDGVQLTDFPNEILTHILSHLHPDSHGAVALVSKQFYALVTTPHAWRMAFLRYFPGQGAITAPSGKAARESWDKADPEFVRSDFRYFTRLTSLASWRSEYLLRTRLLRSVARGKPGTSSGSIGSSSKAVQSSKRASAVLTYNSKLPWTVSNIHAVFSDGKKPPKVVSGTGDLGVGTVSDPTTGRVEKWGLDDPFSFAQLDEVFPNLEFYGLGDGPAATPNIVDVSQRYGIVGGEGFPQGRVHYRALNEVRGRYLGENSAIIDISPEIPKIPELSEAICSVWIAKSSAVPSVTQSMVGIMAGSSLGVITTYAMGSDSAGVRYSNGDITARWVLSPGVPIIAIKVDDSYSTKRRSLRRVWAVALNALGEVFYLRDPPPPPASRAKGDNMTRIAWMSGRSVSWELVEATRRKARQDEFDKNAIRGAYSPRSPSNAMNLSKEQIIAEAREIEKFLRYKPAHFRKVCEGWDMRRKLEVDFAGCDEDGTGENILVITCGHEDGEPIGVHRYTRHKFEAGGDASEGPTLVPPSSAGASSIFGGPRSYEDVDSLAKPGVPYSQATGFSFGFEGLGKGRAADTTHDWRRTTYAMNHAPFSEVTAATLDLTTFALLAPFEDPLCMGSPGTAQNPAGDSTAEHSTAKIPGRRSRLFAIGTSSGSISIWDIRASKIPREVQPLRIIQTESPEISCLALSALYLVHGGSDGMVQIWDPLASSLEPVRTLSSRSSGRVPRHILNANPALRHANCSAVGAIFLDPNPTVLRGVLSFGTFLRYWTYSSTSPHPGRKRRLRHSDFHGRLGSRRHGGAVSSYIAAEAAELRREQEHRVREQARLRNRFGVGLGDLTEEEAIRYAEMVSEESFLLDEHRRLSASDTGSAADVGETASSAGSMSTDTVTPEPSVSGGVGTPGPSLPVLQEETDDDYEAQIQRAIRLSLMEGVNDMGQSPRESSPGEYDIPIKVKKKKGKRSSSASPSEGQAQTPMARFGESSGYLAGASSGPGVDPNEDLELALRLSLEEEEMRQAIAASRTAQGEEFPPLNGIGKGKGKAREE